jgi:hypothetical protein
VGALNNLTLKYFIYEMDDKFIWSWPNKFDNCSKYGYLTESHSNLSGIGTPLIPENGLFNTWHFSLFNSLYNRLKFSKYRTRNPEEANLFIIPYDMALDGAVSKSTCRTKSRCSDGYAATLTNMLKSSKYFNRYQGIDHVLLWSLGQYHPWPYGGCNIILKHTCVHCALTCYWMDPVLKNNHFISVPFPSSYHWWEGIQNLPWKYNNDRTYKVVYIGSTKTLNPLHTKIRLEMVAQCSRSPVCKWFQIEHSSTDMDIARYIEHYKNSVFCLCPPGDDPARKALFDIILSGCIPVIFESGTLYNQYPWHIGETNGQYISVNIPGRSMLHNKLDFMKELLKIPTSVITTKQKLIEKIAPSLQYSLPPLDKLHNSIRYKDDDVYVWDPPFEDAVDMMLYGLIERVNKKLSNISSSLMFSRVSEWTDKYSSVMAVVPRGSP